MAELGASSPGYEIVIEPSHGWFNLRWREFWEYRDLLIILVQRDFISRYKQTILGPAWFVLQPILTMLVFVVMFSRAAGLPTDGIPSPLFYLCGLLGWQYFQQNITTGGATFINNAQLFGKVWFPRLIVPLATVLSNLVAFALQFVCFVCFLAYYLWIAHRGGTAQVTWLALLLPLPLLQTLLLSIGVSLWMSALTAKYRDLVHFNQYVIQIWMFASPTVLPLSLLRAKCPAIVWLNPMSVPVEAFRVCLLGRGTIGLTEAIVSGVFTLLILFTGLALFQRVERTVVDSV
jgi:lipopolysaccharide transport system permease protein